MSNAPELIRLMAKHNVNLAICHRHAVMWILPFSIQNINNQFFTLPTIWWFEILSIESRVAAFKRIKWAWNNEILKIQKMILVVFVHSDSGNDPAHCGIPSHSISSQQKKYAISVSMTLSVRIVAVCVCTEKHHLYSVHVHRLWSAVRLFILWLWLLENISRNIMFSSFSVSLSLRPLAPYVSDACVSWIGDHGQPIVVNLNWI